MEIKQLKRDTAKIEGGDWVDKIPAMGDLRLKVRGSASQAARRAYSAKVTSGEGDLVNDQAYSDKILAEVRHEVILMDWDGLTQDGQPFPYDSDVAKVWCSHPDYFEFQQAVDWASTQVTTRRSEVEEDLSKKSATRSSGSSPGVRIAKAS